MSLDEKHEVEDKLDEISSKSAVDLTNGPLPLPNSDKEIPWSEIKYLAINNGRILYIKAYIDYLISNNILLIPSDMYEENKSFIEEVNELYKEALMHHNLLCDNNGWICQVNNNDNISIWYREEKETSIISLKVNFTVKTSLLNFIATINEYDLLPEVITIVPIETKILQDTTNVRKLLWSKLPLLWPIHSREVAVSIQAFDNLNEYNEILFTCKSMDENNKFHQSLIPPISEKDYSVRININIGTGIIKPIRISQRSINDNGNDNNSNDNNSNDNNSNDNNNNHNNNEKDYDVLEINFVFNIDLKLVLPSSLLNWLTKTFSYYAIKQFRKRCENLTGTKHEQRIKEKQIYQLFRQRFGEWVIQNGHKMSQNVDNLHDNDNDDNNNKSQSPNKHKKLLSSMSKFKFWQNQM